MTNLNNYTRPKLALATMDIFIHRRSILKALKEVLPLLSGTVIDIGCGQMPYREIVLSSQKVKKYIGLDLAKNDIYKNKPDFTWDGKTIPMSDSSIDCAMATELFEHCPESEVVMMEISRVLRPGGQLFFTVPFLWPLHDVPYDQYRFTPFSLERHLAGAGFHEVRLGALGGWNEALAQMIGLYVRRKPMPFYARLFLSTLVFPLVFLLSRTDAVDQQLWGPGEMKAGFPESQMITGIWGTAYKP